MGSMALGMKRLLVALTLSIMTAPSPRAVAEEADVSASLDAEEVRVRWLGRESARAFAAKDFERCRELLLEAWGIRQSYDIAANLGQAERELGNYAAAASYVAYAVRHFAPGEPEQALLHIKAQLAELKSRVVTVQLQVQPPDATVRIDGSEIKPPFGPETFVTPGRHEVEASSNGQIVRTLMEGAAGEEMSVRLVVPQGRGRGLDKPRATTSSIPARTSEAVPKRASRTPLVIGGAVAAVGLGAGLGFHFAASGAKGDLERALDALPEDKSLCKRPSSVRAQCSELSELSKKVDRNKNLSTASLALGSTAALATLLYWLWIQGDEAGTSSSAVIAPSFGAGWAGIEAFTRF